MSVTSYSDVRSFACKPRLVEKLALRGVWAALVFLLVSCSHGGGSSNLGPTIASISPTSSTAGAATFVLTISGTLFANNSLVRWNGSARTTTFVSSQILLAVIPATDVASSGLASVTVNTPSGANTGVSNSAAFTINSAPPPGMPGIAQTISVDGNGNPGNQGSLNALLNADGRYVAFLSTASNLVTPPPAGFDFDVYLRDTCVGAAGCARSTVLASAISGSANEGNSISPGPPAISADGRFVGFLSESTNLVTPSTHFQQAFLRDTCAGAPPGCTVNTSLVSLTSAGVEPNNSATGMTVSGDGRFVAFVSQATNLVTGVSAPNELYLRDTCQTESGAVAGCSPATILASADNSGSPANNDTIPFPALSFDGRFVAFISMATNLPGAPGVSTEEVYVRDTCKLPNSPVSGCTPSTVLVSADDSGVPASIAGLNPSLSDDGRFVSFQSPSALASASNTGPSNVFLRDTCRSSSGPISNCTPSTTTVSVSTGGGNANNASGAGMRGISSTGRFVVFQSQATNLTFNGSQPGGIYVRDTCTGAPAGCTPATLLVSLDSQGNFVMGAGAAISADGHYAAFGITIGIFPQDVLARTGF